MSVDEFNRRIPIDPDAYCRSGDRQRNCALTGGHTWVEGRGYQQNGIEVYVRRCTDCTARLNLPKRGNEHLAHATVLFDNRLSCCDGHGCSTCVHNPCERCGSPYDVQLHHWAPNYLFGWQEANRWPTSYLCQQCHNTWHRVVTPKMGQRAS